MKIKLVCSTFWLQLVVVSLSVCLAALPLVPVVSMAADSGVALAPSPQTETPKVVILEDHKKIAVTEEKAAVAEDKKSETTKKNGEVEKHPDTIDQEKHTGNIATRKTTAPAAAEQAEEGWSTTKKVGIGVGAAAAVGVVLALAGGGGGDSGPKLPTPEMLVGKWNAQSRSSDQRTYSGVYDFYTVGSHTYDIFVTVENVRKQGRGTWTLAEGTNTLKLHNESGSTYIGEFLNEDFTTITITTTDGRWETVLTKQ